MSKKLIKLQRLISRSPISWKFYCSMGNVLLRTWFLICLWSLIGAIMLCLIELLWLLFVNYVQIQHWDVLFVFIYFWWMLLGVPIIFFWWWTDTSKWIEACSVCFSCCCWDSHNITSCWGRPYDIWVSWVYIKFFFLLGSLIYCFFHPIMISISHKRN